MCPVCTACRICSTATSLRIAIGVVLCALEEEDVILEKLSVYVLGPRGESAWFGLPVSVLRCAMCFSGANEEEKCIPE